MQVTWTQDKISTVHKVVYANYNLQLAVFKTTHPTLNLLRWVVVSGNALLYVLDNPTDAKEKFNKILNIRSK